MTKAAGIRIFTNPVLVRGVAVAAFMAVAVGLFALVASGCGGTVEAGGTYRTTARSAPDFSGVTLDGVELSLSEYRGKPLVLAFMASW